MNTFEARAVDIFRPYQDEIPWQLLLQADPDEHRVRQYADPDWTRIAKFDGEGITARYLLASHRLRWTDLKRFVHDARGGFLSTRSRPSWLDRYTGLHILFGGDREPVIEQIRDHLGGEAAT